MSASAFAGNDPPLEALSRLRMAPTALPKKRKKLIATMKLYDTKQSKGSQGGQRPSSSFCQKSK
jgi:hypothetical protein